MGSWDAGLVAGHLALLGFGFASVWIVVVEQGPSPLTLCKRSNIAKRKTFGEKFFMNVQRVFPSSSFLPRFPISLYLFRYGCNFAIHIG